MVLARVANFFTTGIPNSLVDDGRKDGVFSMEDLGSLPDVGTEAAVEEVDHEAARPPYIHVCAFY